MAMEVETQLQPPQDFTTRLISDRGEAVLRARQLAPILASRAEETNEARRIPDETIAELHELGLFGIMTPPAYGGSGLRADAMFAAAVELGRACGSTGWTYGVLAGHNDLLAAFPESTQAEVFGDPNVVVASLLRLNTKPLAKVPGGYRLDTASGRFCSGVDHSNWLVGRCTLEDEPGQHWVLIPRSSYVIHDDWFTVGLQGTGSKSVTVNSSFVPDDHVIPIEEARAPGSSGWNLPFSLCGASIGCAYAAIDAYRESLRAKGGDEVTQAGLIRLAKATADVDAAYLMVLDAIDGHLHADDPGPRVRNAPGRNVSYAVQQARSVANEIFAASGGSSIYLSAPLQRIWRDANAAAAHTSFAWDAAATNFARRFVFDDLS
jgi:3-hydroxy-9,10-secoandrosta-1,3,5(10)-triene-9,17-dione monooxygenase